MSHRNHLKINDGSPAESVPLMQAINGNPCNTLITRNSVFLINPSVKRVSKKSNRYYGVRLVEAKNGHYVEYHHRIPPDLFQKLPPGLIKKEWLNKKGELLDWARFRVKGKLNTVSEEDYEQCAEELLHSVKLLLQNGLNPFQDIIDEYNQQTGQHVPMVAITKDTKPKVTIEAAMKKFLMIHPEGSSSRLSYEVITRLLGEWLGDRVKGSIKDITKDDLNDMLRTKREEKDWKKGTYNDKVTKLRTLFKFVKDEEWIKESPAEKVKKLTHVDKTRHTAYDDAMAERVKHLLLHHKVSDIGLATYRFCMTVYYTLTRPDEETRQLKCKDIRFADGQIYIDPLRAKGGQGGYIPLDPELEMMLREMGVDKAPGEYYIFGKEDKPGPECHAESRFAWFWREHVRKPNGIHEDYTIYGWKHKRVIDLFRAGATAAEIQAWCRHKSVTEFETYLRDLGLNLAINNARAKKF